MAWAFQKTKLKLPSGIGRQPSRELQRHNSGSVSIIANGWARQKAPDGIGKQPSKDTQAPRIILVFATPTATACPRTALKPSNGCYSLRLRTRRDRWCCQRLCGGRQQAK